MFQGLVAGIEDEIVKMQITWLCDAYILVWELDY